MIFTQLTTSEKLSLLKAKYGELDSEISVLDSEGFGEIIYSGKLKDVDDFINLDGLHYDEDPYIYSILDCELYSDSNVNMIFITLEKIY